VGSRAVLDAVVKRKIPSPRQESNPKNPAVIKKENHWVDAVQRSRTDFDNKRHQFVFGSLDITNLSQGE
jgi:hypothetical protein